MFAVKAVQVTKTIAFVGKVMIQLPGPVDKDLWLKLQAPEGWRKRRSSMRANSVVYSCVDMSKQMTPEQWEAVEAHVLLIMEQQ